jgi:hypothetical protein
MLLEAKALWGMARPCQGLQWDTPLRTAEGSARAFLATSHLGSKMALRWERPARRTSGAGSPGPRVLGLRSNRWERSCPAAATACHLRSSEASPEVKTPLHPMSNPRAWGLRTAEYPPRPFCRGEEAEPYGVRYHTNGTYRLRGVTWPNVLLCGCRGTAKLTAFERWSAAASVYDSGKDWGHQSLEQLSIARTE